VVLSGSLEVFRSVHNVDQVVAVRGEGSVVGEMGLLKEGGQRTASVRSREHTALFELSSDPVKAMKECGDPQAALKVLQNLICVLGEKFNERVEAEQVAPASEIAPWKELQENFDSDLEAVMRNLPKEGFFRKAIRLEKLRDTEELIRQGEPSDSFFFLHHGRVAVYHSGEDGTRTLIDRREAPAVIGETGYFAGKPRMATVVADGALLYSRFPGRDFEKLRSRSPEEAIEILTAVARLIIHMNYRFGRSVEFNK
jgi:CRP-like cAMP-binding protein